MVGDVVVCPRLPALLRQGHEVVEAFLIILPPLLRHGQEAVEASLLISELRRPLELHCEAPRVPFLCNVHHGPEHHSHCFD